MDLKLCRKMISKLQAAGIRPTRQRTALAVLLFKNKHRHITAEILHAEAKKENIWVTLSTVYNTLHHFTEAGILKEIVVNSERYFDTNISHHHHFYHEDTELLEDISDEDIIISRLPPVGKKEKIRRIDVVVRVSV